MKEKTLFFLKNQKPFLTQHCYNIVLQKSTFLFNQTDRNENTYTGK